MTGPTSVQHIRHCLRKTQEGPHIGLGHIHIPEEHEQPKARQRNRRRRLFLMGTTFLQKEGVRLIKIEKRKQQMEQVKE
jgi:hypothetical protein